ncbi:hypothetical protein FWH09_00970 [Candidatus Saccharibacteria bacterium]|nr:hypothetical protein [Candidatus Saccharibacteria bacterium]
MKNLVILAIGIDLISNPGGLSASTTVLMKMFSATSGWSGANANSVETINPWFIRGGQSGNTTNAGVESLNRNTGGTNTTNGFRGVVVIRP